MACKVLWHQDVEGTENQWWCSVNTLPGRGTPRDWEAMGGGLDSAGQPILGRLPTPEEFGGVDALVFTAGVGENSAEVRAAACTGLRCLGLELDGEANGRCVPDAVVARRDSPARIPVIATREDLTMLDEVIRVIGKQG